MAALMVMMCATLACKGKQASDIPEDVFKAWDGSWKGQFEVRDANGVVVTRLDVEQTYTSEGPRHQKAKFKETNVETGEVDTALAMNSHDGKTLRCVVQKKKGGNSEHVGRWTGDAIEWRRDTASIKEQFTERVVIAENGSIYYEIRGWGEYNNGERLLFYGKYDKQ